MMCGSTALQSATRTCACPRRTIGRFASARCEAACATASTWWRFITAPFLTRCCRREAWACGAANFEATFSAGVRPLPAHLVEVRVNLDPPFELSITGQVEEGCLFGSHLSLITTYTTVPGSHRLVIHDVIENRAAEPAEMQMLYHCNVGPPFLEAGSRIVAPIRELSPLTARAAEGMDTYDTYPGPTAGFTEQVYCYDLLGDAAGRTLAMLYNAAGDRALALRWNRNDLPCFTIWRNCAALEDGYV